MKRFRDDQRQEIFRFGANAEGQLGPGGEIELRIPQPLPDLPRIAQIAVGLRHTLLLTESGEILSFGANAHGQLGRSSALSRPNRIPAFDAIPPVSSIGAGGFFSAAVANNGHVYSWGDNSHGQLGLDVEFGEHRAKIGRIALDAHAIKVACGERHMLVLTQAGRVYGAGDGTFGQLGKGEREKRRRVALVDGLRGIPVVDVAAGARFSVVRTAGGGLLSFGCNERGQLGISRRFGKTTLSGGFSPTGGSGADVPTLVTLPMPVKLTHPVAEVVCGSDFCLARCKGDAGTFGWGNNTFGQLGHDELTVGAPMLIPCGAVVHLAAGQRHTLIALSSGAVLSFGQNGAGQLGRDDDRFVVGFGEDRDEEEDDAAPSGDPLESMDAMMAAENKSEEEMGPAELQKAVGVAAGGLSSFVVVGVLNEPPAATIDALDLKDVQVQLSAYKMEQHRCAELRDMVHSIVVEVPKVRLDWFQSPTHVTVDLFLPHCSTAGASVDLTGNVMSVMLKHPPVRMCLHLEHDVDQVTLSTLPPTLVVALSPQGVAVQETTTSDPVGRKLTLSCRKVEAKQWAALETAEMTAARKNADDVLIKAKVTLDKTLSGMIEKGLSTIEAVNATFVRNPLRDIFWLFDELVAASHQESLDSLQRALFNAAEQFASCFAPGAGLSSLSPTSHVWEHALSGLVLVLVAPTTSLSSARAQQTRVRIVKTLSALSPKQREAFHALLLQNRVLFGRTVSMLVSHAASLLIEENGKDERNCALTCRLVDGLHALSVSQRLLPESAFVAESLDSISDAFLAEHARRLATSIPSLFDTPCLASTFLKRRYVRMLGYTAMARATYASLASPVVVGAIGGFIPIVQSKLRCDIQVRRECLLEDGMVQLRMAAADKTKVCLPMVVSFVGEDAVDQGGPLKEFFQLSMQGVLDESYGMFVRLPHNNTYWMRSSIIDNSDMFRFVGQICGFAVYNDVLVPARFPKVFWEKLAGAKVGGIDALADIDPVVAKNMRALLDYGGDVENDFDLQFVVVEDVFGEIVETELLPNGKNINVTERNRQTYVELYCDHVLNGAVRSAFDAFCSGFKAAALNVPLALLTGSELEELVCGAQDTVYDLGQLRVHAVYDGGFADDSPTVQHFWDIVSASPAEVARAQSDEKRAKGLQLGNDVDSVVSAPSDLRLTAEQRAKLLQFWTGTSSVPLDGLSAIRVKIQRNSSDPKRLISASTCFNTLLVPEYNDKKTLYDKLLICVEHYEGFGTM